MECARHLFRIIGVKENGQNGQKNTQKQGRQEQKEAYHRE